MAYGYCDLCRNEKVGEKVHCDTCNIRVCDKCEVHVLNGPLKEAFQRWVEQRQRDSMCCGQLNYDFGANAAADSRAFGHLSFHGKGWSGTHNGTWVEFGVSFYATEARTYYLRDFDSYCDSKEYGEKIPYTTPMFWATLMVRLNGAPKAAYDADLCSCEECGYHYVAGNGPCCAEAVEG